MCTQLNVWSLRKNGGNYRKERNEGKKKNKMNKEEVKRYCSLI
jgi:hypothetical protein